MTERVRAGAERREGEVGGREPGEGVRAADPKGCAGTRAGLGRGRDREPRSEGWYVIQVPTGKEAAMCDVIERTAGPDALGECFTPSFETQRKVRGAWQTVQAILFPGYVIAVTRDVGTLKHRLRGVSEFTRLLTMGESFVPLDEADRAWLSTFTAAGDRVIPMSMGVVEGDRIVVTKGPLMGREGWITSVNRRKSLAFIQVEMFGRKIETRIGLGIVRRKPCPNRIANQEKS